MTTIVLRKRLSAIVWLVFPSLTLLAFRSSAWEPAFRARPFNDSYDAMFIAATAGLGLTSLWALRLRKRAGQLLPAQLSWSSAFDLFEIALCAVLAVLNGMDRVYGSTFVWLVAFTSLLAGSVRLRHEQRRLVIEPRRNASLSCRLASSFLVVIAILFLFVPVMQPWSGPPELFVRWHPFGTETELIWRGVFLSFALGMLMAARDPAGRDRLFLVALVLSGYMHSMEMALDNLRSAKMGGMNGNPEHLYGDVLGWFVIASVSLLFLRVMPAQGTLVPKSESRSS